MVPLDNFLHANSDIWLKGGCSPNPIFRPKTPANACKVLEPSRKTLQSLDAQRIMTAFEDTVKRMEITTALPYVLESLPRFSVVLGHDLVSHLENHVRLQNKYTDMMDKSATFYEADLESKPQEMRVLEEEGEGKEASDGILDQCAEIKIALPQEIQQKQHLQRELSFLKQSLKHSLKDILRYFKKNPKAIEAILGTKQIRSQGHASFVDAMTSLQTSMKERLLTSPLEQQEKKTYLTDVINREKKTNSAKEKLEIKYKAAVEDKETEIAKRNATIVGLRNELDLLEQMTNEQQRRSLTDALKQTAFDTKASKTKTSTIQEEIYECIKKTHQNRKNNRENETCLRKRTFKTATEVYNWVQKYDADLDGRQDEYDLYTRMYDSDKKELSELQAQFAVLEKEYNAILEERRKIEEERVRMIEEKKKKNAAAVKIQALWRGHYQRKMMRSKAKKTQKTGKKGKKGKK